MDRLKTYFNKPWNSTVMDDATPIPDLVLPHLSAVYWTLFMTTFVSSFGAHSHQIQNIGGWISTLIFFASITLLSKIQPWWQISRFMLLVAAAYCFGASIGPLINFIVVVDQRRDLIYGVAEFLGTILVPAWMVLSPMSPELTMPACFLGFLILWGTEVFILTFIGQKFKISFNFPIQVAWFWYLRHHYSFSLLEFWLIYLLLWPFNITMRAHTQESIYIANHGERYFVSRAIAFFTDFPALTAPRHMGGVMLGNIWGLLGHR